MTRHHRRAALRGRLRTSLTVLAAPFISGEYFTRWSLIMSFVVGTFLSVPSVGIPSFDGYLRGVAVAAVGWMPLAAIGLGAAYAERRLATSPGERVAVIAAAIVGFSAARPFLNDAVSSALFGLSTGGNWATRITTNVVTSVILFTVCAIAVTHHRRLRATTRRLRSASALMRISIAEAAHLQSTVPTVLAQIADDLTRHRDRLLAGPVDYDAVRDYSTRVRSASHRLDELTQWPPDDTSVDVDVDDARGVPVLARLSDTPPLSVGLTYVAATIPFGLTHGGPSVVVAAVTACAALDLAATFLLRRARGLRVTLRGLLFLTTWALVGVGVLALTYALLPHVGALGLVPLLALPLTAAIISLSVDAYRRARAEEVRATSTLRSAARTLATAVESARAPLRRASDLLHGRLQSRCVILAAHVDETPADAATIDTFRPQTDEVLDELRSGANHAVEETIEDLVEAWSVVMDVRVGAEPEARAAFDDPAIGEEASRLVNEALVNAVKHSAAREASVEMERTDDRLRLRISSPGILSSRALVSPATGLGTRAAETTLRQVGDQVVLEREFPLPPP
ncbi:hypothetical protein ACIGEP_07920 [Microbacterium sp. NPDC077663]|uniref:hypothetical protein n=1 Tax=Microbacterium sp. NPDC077663 TaxID=3364189 RepID=UPI0037C840E0